jgi:hypothetical protein
LFCTIILQTIRWYLLVFKYLFLLLYSHIDLLPSWRNCSGTTTTYAQKDKWWGRTKLCHFHCVIQLCP